MRTKSILSLLVIAAALFFVYSCKKEVGKNAQLLDQPAAGKISTGSANCADGYNVALDVNHVQAGSFVVTTFTWTITNTNPGNGKNGTNQDLSHWSFQVSTCLDQYWGNVISASIDTGTGWKSIVLPDIQPDPSQGCYNGDVFKFDYGTKGSLSTKYRLTLLGNWDTGPLTMYFKSGANTGCCTKTVDNLGVGCLVTDDGCSYSQGFWMAKPDNTWPSSPVIGGQMYTQAEGQAIWNTSNAGGITDSKKAFCQLAAVRLSGVDTDPAIAPYVAIIDNWLAHIAKLSPTYLPNQTSAEKSSYGNARDAADQISIWINDHHCQ